MIDEMAPVGPSTDALLDFIRSQANPSSPSGGLDAVQAPVELNHRRCVVGPGRGNRPQHLPPMTLQPEAAAGIRRAGHSAPKPTTLLMKMIPFIDDPAGGRAESERSTLDTDHGKTAAIQSVGRIGPAQPRFVRIERPDL